MSAHQKLLFDYIIVGGGTAGCVIAGRLSEDPTRKVLLLERGEDTSDDPRLRPTDLNTVLPRCPLELLPVDVLFSEEEHLTRGQSITYIPRALGGGPAVSGSFWGRGDPSNYNEWAELVRDDAWSYERLLPFFIKSERVQGARHPERGREGPIHVSFHNLKEPSLKKVLQHFATTFETTILEDHSLSAGQLGVSPMQRSLQSEGTLQRSTSYSGYIVPHLSRKNLTISPTSTVNKVIIDKNELKAIGVNYLYKGQEYSAYASQEVILCAGTIHSPKILLHSGIGPKEKLSKLGVPVVVDLPGVGQNLQEHSKLSFAFELASDASLPISSPSSVAISFLKSPGSSTIDLEIAWGLLPNPTNKHQNILMGYLINLKSESSGEVELQSADPLLSPKIKFNLNASTKDADKMIAAFRNIRAWMLNSKLASAELSPGFSTLPAHASDEQYRRWLSKELNGWYHMAGTCKMSHPQDGMGVVDSRLLVRNVKNVRVADCSIMPRLVSSHPSCTATMIGEKAAALIQGASSEN